MLFACGRLQHLNDEETNIGFSIESLDRLNISSRPRWPFINLPIIELLLANSCLNLGILKTTAGSDRKELCDMSNRNSDAKSASSSGSLDIWLCDKLRS